MLLDNPALGDVIIKVYPLQSVKPGTTDAERIDYHTSINSTAFEDTNTHTVMFSSLQGTLQ